MAVVVRYCSSWLAGAWPGDGELLRAGRIILTIGAAVLALAVSARLLRIEEFSEATRRIARRIAPGRR
jgi:hypothetical protein